MDLHPLQFVVCLIWFIWVGHCWTIGFIRSEEDKQDGKPVHSKFDIFRYFCMLVSLFWLALYVIYQIAML